MASVQHTPTSSVSSTASRSASLWSRSHISKSSTSSLPPNASPICARESMDLVGTQKRLEDVREEDAGPMASTYRYDQYAFEDLLARSELAQPVSPNSIPAYYSLSDQDQDDTWSTIQSQPKRHRSLDRSRNSVTQGLTTRFNSLSRRWRNRSGVGPPLSIITNITPIASPRTSLDACANHRARSTSLTSGAYQFYSPTSMHSMAEDIVPESEVVPIFIDQRDQVQEQSEEDPGLATTPLLPPTLLSLSSKRDVPIQSPLQSPSIASPTSVMAARYNAEPQPFSYLPSPPLSNRPSMISMPRSRANTATADIPALELLSEKLDPWVMKLGHADFTIYPEPYQPNIMDLDHYKEFREDWNVARTRYAQHLARVIEHHGETSKIYKLTEEKWTLIDQQWKKSYKYLSSVLAPQLARLSDGIATPDSPVSLLDKPVSRVAVPMMDKSGKFPELGDANIVGPLSVGVAKVPELQRGNLTPPASPRKRNIIKAIGELFKGH